MDEANFKGTNWRSICSEELNYTHLEPSLSFDELPIAVSELLNVAVHRPLKVWPIDMNALKICAPIERNL